MTEGQMTRKQSEGWIEGYLPGRQSDTRLTDRHSCH